MKSRKRQSCTSGYYGGCGFRAQVLPAALLPLTQVRYG
jgi:hypothetical protein